MNHAHDNLTEALLARLRSGDLTAEEALALNDTLEHFEEEAHPIDTAVEGDPSTPSARLKMRLKRPVQEHLPLSHFEQLCYKELEGELSVTERQELDDITTHYPRYAQQRDAILRTKLAVPTEIVYPYKERLKHYPAPMDWRSLVGRGVAVAACLFFVLWIGVKQLDRLSTPVADELRWAYTQPSRVVENVEKTTTLAVATPTVRIVQHPSVVPPQSAAALSTTAPVEAPTPTTEDSAVEAATPSVTAMEGNVAVPEALSVTGGLATTSVAELAHEMVTEDNELAPLPSLPIQELSSKRVLAMESRDPMPELYHDWELITAEEEVEAFESEVKSFQKKLRPERPLRAKFVDYVLELAAR